MNRIRLSNVPSRAAAILVIAILSVNITNADVITGVSKPEGSNTGDSRPRTDGVYSVSVPPYPLNITSGIGYLINPTVEDAPLGYVLHDHVYIAGHVPDPDRSVVTYTFDEPMAVDQIEVIQHRNGVNTIEAFVGNSLGSLVSIGAVTVANPTVEKEVSIFDFNNSVAGSIFQFVITGTTVSNGYAMYRAYPRDQNDVRFEPALAPGPPRLTVEVSQSGNNVVFDAFGALDLTDLTNQGDGALVAGMDFGTEFVLGGSPEQFNDVKFRGDGAELTPPGNLPFGIDNFFQPNANANTGSRFGIVVQAFGGQTGPSIAVPPGYVSGTRLSGTSTYVNRTFASLGLNLGSYKWTWGTTNPSSLTMIIGAPDDGIDGIDGDHNGDSRSDILWRNSSTGQNWMYLMNGATIASSVGVNTVSDPLWEIVGDGDYNGDGTADVLWRNSSTGQNWMYLMNGATIDSSAGVNTVPMDWEVAGNGDYDGDGKSDILWRRTGFGGVGGDGQNWMYLMNGESISQSLGINTVPTAWEIVGNGDYNGDGNSDTLWRNSSTGQNWIYLMNGPTIDSSVGIVTVPTDWEVAGNGDYDGDGDADILWRNSVTGQNWMYLMNGTLIESSLSVVWDTVYTIPTVWQVAGNGGYNGDGKADILWRNTSTGQNWMYLMNGATVDSSVGVNTVPTDWELVFVD